MDDTTQTSTPDEITHEEILAAVTARRLWEDRQATFYQMRHDGLRRRHKPWPNAADLHYPLVDTLIEKQKPAFVQQIFATETVASFTATRAEWQAYQTAAGQWFDYKLKQRSNFEDEIVVAADRMLQGGKAVMKVYWDAEEGQLTFEAPRTTDIIVPPWTGRVQRADWLVHVQRYSKHAYRRLANFDTSEETINSLTGGDKLTPSAEEQHRATREGITKPGTPDEIVVWEVFYRQNDGKIWVKTYSPSQPKRELRPRFGLPYCCGAFGKTQQPMPFFELNAEIKDRGYYDARGIAERVAPFEAKLCKDWNSHSDCQTLANQPIFYAPNGLPNTANLRMIPGQILPFQLESVTMPPPPVDIMQSMMNTRQIAQELTGVIDYGTPAQQSPRDRKTATEVNLIGNVMGQGNDLRARIFRRELSYGLQLAWGILLQYEANALEFFFVDELMELPADALRGEYRIELSGSGDNNNRQLVLQKAISRNEMLRGLPWVDQVELTKSVLEADDPRLAKRLIVNQGTQQAMQVEDQAQEISILLLGFPAEVRPTDDDMAHLQSLFGFLQRRVQTGEPIGAETTMLMAQHAMQHAQALQKKQPQIWQQAKAKIEAPLMQLQQAAQVAQQQLQQQQQAQLAAQQQAAMVAQQQQQAQLAAAQAQPQRPALRPGKAMR